MKRFSKLTMLLGIVLLCTMPAKAQWAWLNPTPQANEFFDGHAFSATEYILVGSNGAIVHTDDGGMTWNDIPNPLLGTPFNAVSVVFTDPQQGMISYANGNLLRTMNGGATWEVVVPPAKQVQYLFKGPSGAIWGSGSLGALTRTTDHGMSWEEFDTGIDNVIFDIAFPSAGTIMASCGQGLIITSNNNGNSWSQQQPNLSGDIVSMEFIDAQRGFALQKSRFLLRTDDGGQSWTDTTFGVNEFRSIRIFDSQVGWVISNSIGNIYRTDDGGQSFKLIEVDTLTNYSFQNVVPVSQDVALVFGSGGSVFRTTDRGQTWEQLGGGESRENIYAVSSLSDDEVWVFGEDLALFSGDAGVFWTENRSPGTDAFRLGYALSDQRIVGGGKQGEMWLSTDAGVTWTQVATLAGAGQIEQIEFVDNLNGWVTGAHGTIARTTDGGDSWLDSDPGVTHDFFGIDARSADEAWVVGDGGVMYRTTNAGQSWDAMNSNTSANLRSIEFSSATNGWAGGQVQVLRTTDGGTTWNRVVIPGVDFMYRIDFVDEDIGFFMTSRSILRTKDGGDTFYRTDYPALGQRDIDARASGYAWLVGDYGAVLRYTPAPVIQIIPGFSDFGQVPTNLYTERTFEVQSVGERDLDVTNFSTLGAGYTIEESTPGLLPPGSSTTVRIRFTPPDTGVFRGVLSVVSDARLGKASSDLVGTGITPPPLQFSHDPAILDFGEVRLCDLAEKTVYIENVSDRNVFLDSVTVVGPDSASFMIAAPPGFIFTPGKKDSILVLCVPKRMGTLNATIIVVNRDQAEPRYPIPVTAEGINPVITPDPDEIRFGFVFVGNQDTKTLTIENTGTAPLEISNWWIGGTDSLEFEITRDPDVQVPIGGTTTLDVQWSAQEPFGGRDAMVVIESDDCLTPALEVPIQARPTSTGISRIDALPQAYSLSQNYPNPFSVSRDAQTLYEFTLPIRATVEISMYNSLGERVKKIVSGDFTAGTYSASLDGANLEPGVYFVEMRAIAGPNAASIQRVKTVVTR